MRRVVEARPQGGEVGEVQILLGCNGGECGNTARPEPVTMTDGCVDVSLERRFTTGTSVARVKVAERFLGLRGPLWAIGRGREPETGREQHGFRGNITSDAEVAVDEFRCDGHCFADVCESLATDAVRWELVYEGGAHVDAGEVSDGVVEFDVGEAAEGDGAWVTGFFGSGVVLCRIDPCDEGLSFLKTRLGRLFRGHVVV